VTLAAAVIELLVGAACVVFAWPCWRRGEVRFRVLAGCLAIAGAIAVANAVRTVVAQ
jgi:hypothetical protein